MNELRFSERLDWRRPNNRLTRQWRKMTDAGIPVLDLTQSNPTKAALQYDAEEILAPLRQPGGLLYEPHPRGLHRAREAVAGYYAAKAIPVDPGRVLLTASTSDAYGYLFKLFASPGDEILAPLPSYPLFEYLASLEGVRLRSYPLRYDGSWWIDLAALREGITHRTRAVLAVSPNNPTGSYVKHREMAELTEICARHGLPLIVDEVFADYALDADPDQPASALRHDSSLVIVLSGLSKLTGLPQMKLAWLAVNGPNAACQQVVDRLELVADMYLSVSTPVQHAAERWLRNRTNFQEQLTQRLRGNLRFLRESLRATPCDLLRVEGGWYATVRLPRTTTEEEWAMTLLREDRTLVQPGYFFDFPSEPFIVISLMTPPDEFPEGVMRLIQRVGVQG